MKLFYLTTLLFFKSKNKLTNGLTLEDRSNGEVEKEPLLDSSSESIK